MINRLFVTYFLPFFIIVACSFASSDLDKRKFDGVNRTARAVANELASGTGYQSFGAALQKFSSEIGVLKGRDLSDQEKELTKNYSDLYSIYKDGFILWKYEIEFSRYGFVPKGLIYVGQDIEPIIVKYRISADSHLYAPTKQYWKSIPADSIQIIWKNADSQMRMIDNILNYR